MHSPTKEYPQEIPPVVGGWHLRPTSSLNSFYEAGRVSGFAGRDQFKASQPQFMKMQRGSRSLSVQKELQNYEELKQVVYHLPAIIDHGKEGEWTYLVFEYLGHDLGSLLESYSSSGLHWILDIVRGMFFRVCEIHTAGFIHGDIKLENFVYCQDSLDVSIIDFETLKRSPVSKGAFFGTAMWASQYSLRGEATSNRDDLISLAYCIAYVFCNGLPWTEEDTFDLGYLASIKASITADDLCIAPIPPSLKHFIEHVLSLDYSTPPDYLYLYDCLEKARLTLNGAA